MSDTPYRSNITDCRAAAALAVRQVLNGDASLNTAIPAYVKHLPFDDHALFKALCFGVCRHYRSLQSGINPLLKKPFKDKDADLLALLMIGAYQLSAMRVPAYAAIDSCVTASKRLNKGWASGLINAVLRRYQQQLEQGTVNRCDDSDTEHPDWLLAKLRHYWPEHWSAIIEQNNAEPPLCLRVNTRKLDRQHFIEQLAETGLSAHPGALSDDAVYVDDRQLAITELPAFAEGLVSVQDEAAQLAASLLDLAPNQVVLDACAAPGGKTCHMLEREPVLHVTAVDSDSERLQRVQQNLDRLRLQATLKTADINDLDNWWDGQSFDRILCDVPCSATGVIRRHPDIKLLRTSDDIKQLAELQLSIVKTLWQCLKPGGIMVYATCSVLAQENTRIIERFCKQTEDCQELPIDAKLGGGHIESPHGVQLIPQADGHDGFFYARLYKRENEPQ